jgi:hypothetical protein
MPPYSLRQNALEEYDDRDDILITSVTPPSPSYGVSSLPSKSPRTSSSFQPLELVADTAPIVSNPALQNLSTRSSGSMIRSRLLNRLGISSRKNEECVPRVSKSISMLRRGGPVLSFEETLKADFGKPDLNLQKKKSSMIVSGGSEHPSVSFNSVVQVHTIPKRTEYSDRIRATLWTHPLEMQRNTVRNSLEFAAEGWDWRNVAEDEDMVICAGERIHPIHFLPHNSITIHRGIP